MVDLMNSGMVNLASLAVSLLVLVIGLVLWFFVNRASSRANEQIELLEALLDQQKRQNALLRRLCEANEPEKEEPVKPVEQAQAQEGDDDFIRLVAER
ncbi:MAG TPA: YebO family protein [Scandinavium sp.]|jgi:flagellar motor component MotA|uniref:YebO family protein n=1 Tax=Scandinavium sp. TaxID=2830653 RepID=UPI002E341A0C|nr:YebO family protein [Scandinavium sp.]HEX4502745.1 YebO family protein [Scandinavium sp.]